MVKGSAIFALPSSDPGAIRDAVMADLVVEYKSQDVRHEVDKTLLELLDRYCFFPGIWESYSVYTVILPSVPTSQEVLRAVKKVSGIGSVRIELVEERYELHNALFEAMDRKLAALQLGPMSSKLDRSEAMSPKIRTVS